MSEFKPLSAQPLSTGELDDLKKQIFASARRMSNEQILDLADAMHDVIRARQAIRRTHGIERISFAAEA